MLSHPAEPVIMAESRNLILNSPRELVRAAMDVKAGSVTVTVRERDGREKVEEECEWRFSNEFR